MQPGLQWQVYNSYIKHFKKAALGAALKQKPKTIATKIRFSQANRGEFNLKFAVTLLNSTAIFTQTFPNFISG